MGKGMGNSVFYWCHMWWTPRHRDIGVVGCHPNYAQRTNPTGRSNWGLPILSSGIHWNSHSFWVRLAASDQGKRATVGFIGRWFIPRSSNHCSMHHQSSKCFFPFNKCLWHPWSQPTLDSCEILHQLPDGSVYPIPLSHYSVLLC